MDILKVTIGWIWEHPIMTSDFRVGRGVQNDPPKPDIIGQKLSDMVGRRVENDHNLSEVIYGHSL